MAPARPGPRRAPRRANAAKVRAVTDWTPDSWQAKAVAQEVRYPDPDALTRVLTEMRQLPPLVTSWEVEALRTQLAAAARGDAFVLQGGDCAESFDDCRSEAIAAKLKILMQMSLVLVHGTRRPVVRIGRIAGQYAKPRSADVETKAGVTLPSYRGDSVNREPFTPEDRTPDPVLLLRGYERAALTLNFVRALADGGFADLHHPEYWDISFAEGARHVGEYHRIVEQIREGIDFVTAVTGIDATPLKRVDFYTSHEALALPYDAAQTRTVPRRPGWYNLSTHMPWIGMRTAQLDGAHVEYFRGISNPIGVKIGAAMDDEWLQGLNTTLNPQNVPGRLALIHRFGAREIANALPRMLNAVRATGQSVLWICDPMHGNTETSTGGLKTRRFENILREIELAFQIHREMGSVLGGVHIELTGEDVTECTGGARGLSDADLQRAYLSTVDPRLNYEQALELALLIAERAHARRA